MVDQVYRIEELRDRVLALLRKQSQPMTAGAICVELGLPFWAVQSGLDAALLGGLVDFCSLGFSVPKGPLALMECAQAAT